jgi:Fe-S-cluster containining protein
MKVERTECQCNKCQGFCEKVPGWFAPGEAQKVADFLGLPLKKLFKLKLAIEYWLGDSRIDETVFVLAPTTDTMEPGTVAPTSKPFGRCAFFDTKTRKCTIHPVKPFECAVIDHDPSKKQLFREAREDNVREWAKKQKEIERVYGKKPTEPTCIAS